MSLASVLLDTRSANVILAKSGSTWCCKLSAEVQEYSAHFDYMFPELSKNNNFK